MPWGESLAGPLVGVGGNGIFRLRRDDSRSESSGFAQDDSGGAESGGGAENSSMGRWRVLAGMGSFDCGMIREANHPGCAQDDGGGAWIAQDDSAMLVGSLHLFLQRVNLVPVSRTIENTQTGVHQVSASQRAKKSPH